MSWDGWASLGGATSGGEPAVASNADGRLEVFVEAPGPTTTELWHVWQEAGGAWSGWASLGAPPGSFLGFPVAARNQDGRLEAFVRVGLMSTGVVWHVWQDPASPTAWSGWDDLGGPPGGVGAHFLVVGQNADGRLELFTLGTDGAAWHVWQVAAGGAWAAWTALGQPAGTSIVNLALGTNADGRLDLFGTALDGALWHTWQEAGGGWSAWASLGGPAGANLAGPAVGRNADGRLEVVAVADQHAVWHLAQSSAGGGWGSWASLGAPPGVAFLGTPRIGANQDGRLEVFLFGVDDAVWHIWQEPGGGWSTWESLGGEPANAVGVGRNADGRLEVFATARPKGGAQPLWHRWQVAANGPWSFVHDWEQVDLVGAATKLYTPIGGTVLARTTAGLFRSGDDGETWTADALPVGAGLVAVDPTTPSILYAATATAVQKSTNGGASWAAVLTTGAPTLALAVSPADHDLVYAASGQGSGAFTLRRSADGGATWTTVMGPLLGDLCIWAVLILAPHPTDPTRVLRTSNCYAGRNVPGGDGLHRSADRGATWTEIFHPVGLYPSRLVGGGGTAPARLYVGAHLAASPGGGKLFRSDDDGATWNAVLTIASGPSVGGLAYDPSAPDRVWAGLTSGVVQASADGGATWTQLGRDGLGAVADLALSRDGSYLFAATSTGVWRIHL